MNVLVCVKRVPLTGGKIVLTEDAQAIATQHLGFTISPHEECAVEEAVRLVEQHGGESVVLTLGPAEAEEQLRDAMALGIDRAIHLLTQGEEWDPQATATAIVAAIAAERATGIEYDLVFFGNESADSGGYQVGIRVAHALGVPVATGLKGVVVEGTRVRCEQEVPGGRDVFDLPLPAVVTVKEGLNFPRYPSVPGRMRAQKKPLAVSSPTPAPPRLEKIRLITVAGETSEAEILGRGPEAAPQVVEILQRIGGRVVAVLVVVERQPGGVDELSLQALALARGYAAGTPVHALVVGRGGEEHADLLAEHGVSTVHEAEHEIFVSYAPTAVARAAVELTERLAPAAVVAAGSERGNEVMAHVGALLDLPVAANCIEATAGDPARVTRIRWGGSLLEEANVHGTVKLLTVAPHTVEAEPVPAGKPTFESFVPTLSEVDQLVRVSERTQADAGGVSLAEAKVVVSSGRGAGSTEGFGIIEELAGLLGGAVGCSRAVTMAGWRPHTDQVGQTGTKIAPDIYIACGISGATQHMAGCKGAKSILAINTDPEAPILASADYAVIGDLHEVVPAISAELRKAGLGKAGGA